MSAKVVALCVSFLIEILCKSQLYIAFIYLVFFYISSIIFPVSICNSFGKYQHTFRAVYLAFPGFILDFMATFVYVAQFLNSFDCSRAARIVYIVYIIYTLYILYLF